MCIRQPPPAPAPSATLPPSPTPPTPPPAPPPPPGPPAPPPGETIFGQLQFVISASAALGGYTSATFDAAAKGAFVDGISAMYSVLPSQVAVRRVADAPGRRRLRASSVLVDFAVTTASKGDTDALLSRIRTSSPDALLAALQSSGLTACTGVAVSEPVVEVTVAEADVSAIADISQATASVTASFAGLDAQTASAQQTAFLGSLSSTANVSSIVSAAVAENTASLVLAVVNASAGTLSVSSQTSALSILNLVASAPINATGGAAQSITSALSVVAASAAASNAGALTQVQAVLTSLASSQTSSLVSLLALGGEPPAPVSTSSPTIQTLVQIDAPGSSRLTTQPLTAPGSPSSFNPMPPGLLPSNTAVVTQFFSLAFDPNGANTTGVTRLAFTNADGSPIGAVFRHAGGRAGRPEGPAAATQATERWASSCMLSMEKARAPSRAPLRTRARLPVACRS